MNPLDEIIEILSSENCNLENALVKTKVFLYKIGKKELSSWVGFELNGYASENEVPDYRVVPARILGNVVTVSSRHKGFQLPLHHLDDDMYEDAYKCSVVISISQITELLDNAGNEKALQHTIPTEFAPLYAAGLAKGCHVERVYKEIPLHQFVNIKTQVKTRLLDFLLELSDQISSIEGDAKMEEKAKKVDASSMFQHAIFGDNVTINLGDGNSININNNITTNDFSSLRNALSQHGVSNQDIDSLETSIIEDGTQPVNSKEYGPKVNSWLVRMLQKAADSTWKVSVAAAAPVLTNALNHYFGY
ncbi:TPA: hypothetical protein ACVEY8_002672 [Yersinia enterocolitica]|uniref:AbiTii domain-containing protein n=1 Tax=Yersinia enterocolitica TaxID=630 RepID=UPI001C8EB222|nr:hypothetical protein [Yersinia enterocolitica]MBX9498747.1 hypothetical protein [Yersinia enterocolitica]HDV7160971.1 hypothetical protein [Yersinia enterocolitica]HEB9655994.1 hypothetical protein [Yersinia enterocolitica]